MDRFIFSSKQEFLDRIKRASAIILYADTSLPIWRTVLCSVGEINMQILSYNKYEVIEILSGTAERFRMFWSKVPEIKYYFIQKLNENDKYGAVVPAKSNEVIEKWLEAEIR
jgi:hypothetical protein